MKTFTVEEASKILTEAFGVLSPNPPAEQMKVFTIEASKGLMFPTLYAGEWAGWDWVAVQRERNGLWAVNAPDLDGLRLYFRKADLEQHGRAKSVDRHGRPDRFEFEAFIPGLWDVELDERGCTVRYVLRDA